jgi:hypothetical protein
MMCPVIFTRLHRLHIYLFSRIPSVIIVDLKFSKVSRQISDRYVLNEQALGFVVIEAPNDFLCLAKQILITK